MSELDYNDLRRRMTGAITALKHEFSGLRTGRASASMLDTITVEAYGSPMPINQVATVSIPEPRMISVQVWDRSMVAATEKAIRESSLGLNPVVDGQVLRLPIPELNEERRVELAKVAHKYAESAKVAVRHVRRDGMDIIKKAEKAGEMGEDESHVAQEKVQKMTDEFIAEVDDVLAKKEQEIKQV
ncbi:MULTISPECIES: ribosome recycling factor [Pseudovibrio]|uniref:ribosome recycling factor n=1 Tax=Stappiaceae TaxID=2821832 RepID=UPI0023664D81|nr:MULTISPECIES: ribosome recycling factor [Pseudovibrio]MDD7908578.1 ribosome recycling factor [Pseudovibrio exalbescens]MDX5592730.1 ribosome recycling factor [Pseudovibrio sp. SPO723]